MNNSSSEGEGEGEDDSVNSFGDYRSRSEGNRTQYQHRVGNITQHTSPTPEVNEEEKEAPNSSSDTANFFQNTPAANLSFDNESAIGAHTNPIRLTSSANVHYDSESHWENHIDSSMSDYANIT